MEQPTPAKVLMSLPDGEGCGHYRVLFPGEAATLDNDVEVCVKSEIRMNAVHTGPVEDRKVRRVGLDGELEGTELVVLSRPLLWHNSLAVEALQRQGVAVVIDIDDDFHALGPQHLSWFKTRNPESNPAWLQKACSRADLVTCTTPALARRYAIHGRFVVLPNFIPRRFLDTPPSMPKDGRTLGWAGWVPTHPGDLEATRGGVAEAMRDADWHFLNVGTGDKVGKNLGMGLDQWLDHTGALDFEDYHAAVARFDVGIAPFGDTAFNRAKSALKGMEMAAVNVPFVASPIEDYQRIADLGIGELAKWKARDWRSKVKRLCMDESWRGEVAERGREAMREQTYERNAWRWMEAWSQALVNRRRRART